MLIYAKIVIQLELLLEHIVELTHGKLHMLDPTKSVKPYLSYFFPSKVLTYENQQKISSKLIFLSTQHSSPLFTNPKPTAWCDNHSP